MLRILRALLGWLLAALLGSGGAACILTAALQLLPSLGNPFSTPPSGHHHHEEDVDRFSRAHSASNSFWENFISKDAFRNHICSLLPSGSSLRMSTFAPSSPAAPLCSLWPRKRPHSLTHLLSSAPAGLSQPAPDTAAARDMPGKELGLGMAGCNSDSCDSMVSTASNHSQRVSRPVAPSLGIAHPSQNEVWVRFLLSPISAQNHSLQVLWQCLGSPVPRAAQGPQESLPQSAQSPPRLRGSDGADLSAAWFP